MARQVKEHIQAGDVFQLVLSQRFQRRTKADPFEIYRFVILFSPPPPYIASINSSTASFFTRNAWKHQTPDYVTSVPVVVLIWFLMACRALRVVNPSPYMLYAQARGSTLVASSPEILCKVEEDGTVTNRHVISGPTLP